MNLCSTTTDDDNSSIKVKKTGIVGEVAEGSSSVLVHVYLTPLVLQKVVPAPTSTNHLSTLELLFCRH